MLNSIVNYGRFPTIVSVQCLEHEQLPRCSPMSDVTTSEAVMETITNVLYWPAISPSWHWSLPRAPHAAVVTPLRHAATQLTGLWRRRQPFVWDPWELRAQPARVYKAITACPGSWIIRVQASIMKVGCVSVQAVLQLHCCRLFTLQSWDSDILCSKEFSANIWCNSKNIILWIDTNHLWMHQWHVYPPDAFRDRAGEYVHSTQLTFCGHWHHYCSENIQN